MSRNGSGVYSLPSGNPVVTGTSISSTWANNTMNDLANALTGSVASDGQTTMSGNLQMGGNKVTGLANGSNPTDAVTYSQLTGLAPATTGSSILAGNGTGGFTNVSLATGLAFSAGTLSANIDQLLPSQTGNSGKVLTTNGTTSSWGTAGSGGSVTSVAVSGGTTGLTTSGGPITTTGTITIAGTLAVASGGTGSTTASGALTNLLPTQSGNSGKFLTTNGTTTAWSSAGTGTVTSVGGTGSGLGFSLSGTVTSTGNITLATPSAASLVSTLGAGTLTGTNAWSGTNSFSGFTGFGTSSNPFTATVKNLATTSTTGGVIFGAYSTGGDIPFGSIVTSTGTSLNTFYYGSAPNPTVVGSITTNGTGVTYGTSSDRRLKTNVNDYSNSGLIIDAIKPRTFTWVSSNKVDVGFIADELQQVIPDAVFGQPNAVNEQGEPIYQQIDCSTPEMMANIIAELQSLRKRVAELEAK